MASLLVCPSVCLSPHQERSYEDMFNKRAPTNDPATPASPSQTCSLQNEEKSLFAVQLPSLWESGTAAPTN